MSVSQGQVQAERNMFASSRWQWLRPVGRFIRYKPLGAGGAAILLLLVFVAVFAPILAPESPTRVQPSLRLQPPNATARLGRDDKGRDLVSRLMYGARVSIGVGFAAVLLSTTIKIFIGLFSAYRLGWTDLILQRIVDGVQALPQLVILITAAVVLPRGPLTLILLLGTLNGIRGSRVVRSAVLSIKQNDYITAAQALGATESRILLRHILPNVFAPVMVVATVNLGGIILTEASLSFLGLGLEPPTVSWGQMLSLGSTLGGQLPSMMQAPIIAIAPGVCISAAVYGINMLGDALRDVLDPRLRGSGAGG